jgi:hypothetical protein
MAKWEILGKQTNVELTGSQIIATSATGTTTFDIGSFRTNAGVNAGELCITPDGTHSKFMTFEDAITNISLDANGNVNVNDHSAEADHIAVIADRRTNIWLDSNGRIIVSAGGTNSSVINIGETRSNAYRDSNGALILSDITTALNNLLLESGDDLLQESGSKILL